MATLKDLDNSLAALKQTIADTATRTSAKLDDLAQKLAAALAANQPAPDLSAEIASIQDDIAALTAVAPADPLPVVAPAPTPVDPTATVVS